VPTYPETTTFEATPLPATDVAVESGESAWASRSWLFPMCAALLVLAWLNRFMQDDAYIILRYARHLADGHGLVWNVGERVEGYSSFLYTVLMALPYLLGIDAVATGHVIGLACFVGSLLLTFGTAERTLGSVAAALLTVALLGTNYTFSIFATGGLETSMHVFLVCLGLWLLARGQASRWSPRELLALSGVVGLLILTRPDSVVPCIIFIAIAMWRLSRAPRIHGWRDVGMLLAPAAAIVGIWLGWKLSYYGELLPNTYYVKVASATSLYNGFRYLYLFMLSYWLIPLGVLAVPLVRGIWREQRDVLSASLLLVAAWVPYVLRIGGDFMEFRFIVPVLPALMLLIVFGLMRLEGNRTLRASLVVILLVGSVHHALVFDRWPRGQGPESRRDLQGHLSAPEQNWIGIGKALAAAAGADRSLRIAVGPAGAIPYYSQLPAIDMIGLTDHWVARHGDVMSAWPGHQRVAPFHYLARREVHLLIGHPVLRSTRQPRVAAYGFQYFQQVALPSTRPEALPASVRVVEMPIDQSYYLPMLYLRPHPTVDALLQRGAWRDARFVK
jgi:arabinofuranosyltransferase